MYEQRGYIVGSVRGDEAVSQQAQYRTSWSYLATQHLMLLCEQACSSFKAPELRVLARHWQDRCLEVSTGASISSQVPQSVARCLEVSIGASVSRQVPRGRYRCLSQ